MSETPEEESASLQTSLMGGPFNGQRVNLPNTYAVLELFHAGAWHRYGPVSGQLVGDDDPQLELHHIGPVDAEDPAPWAAKKVDDAGH